MKKNILSHYLSLFFILFIANVFAQVDSSSVVEYKPKKFSLEIEPTSLFLNGFSGGINYHPIKRHKLSLGLVFVTVNVPNQLRNSIFNEVGTDDTSSVRLSFQAALNLRYKFLIKPFSKKGGITGVYSKNSPYIGLITGWEYFDIQQPSYNNQLRISTFVITPYIGYEFFFFKEILYINPQIRGVTYFGTKKSDSTRPESLKPFVFLPQIGLGVKF